MTGWWRRNAVAVGLVVILVPATIGITFSNEWGTYYSGRPSQPVEVAENATADFGGAAWQVVSATRLTSTSAEGQEAGLPPGSDLVVVTTEVTPGVLDGEGKSPSCELRLEEHTTGGDVTRSWGDAGFDPIDYTADAGTETYCNSDLTTAYTLETLFVVPSDAGTDLAMNLQVVSQLPKYLELALPATRPQPQP